MVDDDNILTSGSIAEELRLQTENLAFQSGDMIVCESCGRTNPPNRLNCLYCARELKVGLQRPDLIRPNLRKLENWEPGFNVIVHPTGDANRLDFAKIARAVGLEIAEVEEIFGTKRPLPIARVGSEADAQIVVNLLKLSFVSGSIISDESFMLDRLPIRLRTMEIEDMALTLVDFNTGIRTKILREDLSLIVSGTISESKTDQLEKKQRRGEAKILDQIATASDESVLDIYDRRDGVGFRIMLKGFDFSCLGDRKGMLAVENMRRLVAVLHDFAPNARLVTDYGAVRHALSATWEVERRKDSQGLKRGGLGKITFGNTVSSSNLRQFNKFSRLQWHLL